jgi:hypothetical protein
MAAPHVAGVVALAISARKSPNLVARDTIVDAIVDTSLLQPASGSTPATRAAMFAAIGSAANTNNGFFALDGSQRETSVRKLRLSMLVATNRNGSFV